MSYEIGPSMRYVHVGDNFAGFSAQNISETLERVKQDIPEATGMQNALATVLEIGNRDVIDALEDEGKALFGANIYDGDYPPEGLLYTESEGGSPVSGFSIVRMSLWVIEAGYLSRQRPIGLFESQRTDLRNFMADVAFSDVDELDPDDVWGVPVNRLTKIIPLNPQQGDALETFRYGHRKDAMAIGSLDLPEELKKQIAITVSEYHEAEVAAQ